VSESNEISQVDTAQRSEPFEIADESVRQQYELLSILDSKASALLTFNAVALTALSVFPGSFEKKLMHLALDIVFLVMLVSCTLLLGIVVLKWTRPEDGSSQLDSLRQVRTRRYNLAWKLSISGVFVLILVSLVHTVGTALQSTNTCGEVCQVVFSENVFGNLDAKK